MSTLPEQDLLHILENTAPTVWNALAGSQVFITGGTGFVGRWLVESLLYANHKLALEISPTVLTRNGSHYLLDFPETASRINVCEGNIRDFRFPSGEFPFIIHAAVEQSPKPADALLVNLEGTRRVLEFARHAATQRFLYTSSGAVYGTQPVNLSHLTEQCAGSSASYDPTTAYGQAKRASEFLCAAYSHQYGFAATIARLFAFSGPGLPLDRNFAAGNFVAAALADRPISIQSDGTSVRSYLYAADMAVWLLTILVNGEPARPYNVGSNQAVSIAELAQAVSRASGEDVPIQIACHPVHGQLPQRYVPSVERAQMELGLRQLVSLEDGLQRMFCFERERAERALQKLLQPTDLKHTELVRG